MIPIFGADFPSSAFLQNSLFFWLRHRLHGHLRGLKIQEDSPWWRKEKSKSQLKFIITFNKQNTIHYHSQQYYIVQLQRFSLSIDCMAVWLLCSCCSCQPFLILFLRALKIDRNIYTKTFKIGEIKTNPTVQMSNTDSTASRQCGDYNLHSFWIWPFYRLKIVSIQNMSWSVGYIW